MNCYASLAFLLLVGCTGGLLSNAALAADTSADYAQDLATSATQRATLEQIRDFADPAFRDVLQALKEGALYSWPQGLLIFTDDGVFVDLAGTPAARRTPVRPFSPRRASNRSLWRKKTSRWCNAPSMLSNSSARTPMRGAQPLCAWATCRTRR